MTTARHIRDISRSNPDPLGTLGDYAVIGYLRSLEEWAELPAEDQVPECFRSLGETRLGWRVDAMMRGLFDVCSEAGRAFIFGKMRFTNRAVLPMLHGKMVSKSLAALEGKSADPGNAPLASRPQSGKTVDIELLPAHMDEAEALDPSASDSFPTCAVLGGEDD